MNIELQDGRVIKPYAKTKLTGVFEITPFKKTRSNGQNRYIHGYLFPEFAKIMTDKFNKKVSAKMAKIVLKSRCGADYIELIDEWVITPTSKMKTDRMVRFVNDSLKYIAIKYNEYLREPNEIEWGEIYNRSEK